MTTQTKKHNKLQPINPDTSCKYMILRNIAEQITNLEAALKTIKSFVVKYWDLAVPLTDPTEHYFITLNGFKDSKRDIQKRLRNLRYIQKVVKLFPDDELSLKFATYYNNTAKGDKELSESLKPKKPDSRKTN